MGVGRSISADVLLLLVSPCLAWLLSFYVPLSLSLSLFLFKSVSLSLSLSRPLADILIFRHRFGQSSCRAHLSVSHQHHCQNLTKHAPAPPIHLPLAGVDSACGTACYNPATQCCAEAETSTVGEFFNGGCFAGPYCQLKFKGSTGIVSIVGAWCLARRQWQS